MTNSGISLGDRMKRYENVSRHYLCRRTPVIIRIDGKAFHTYTKRCDKPFDTDLHTIRKNTLSYLCSNIQGCIMGYSQSDELSLLLKDWTSLTTDAWFGYNLNKVVSISASMCTSYWNEMSLLRDLHDTSTKFNTSAVFDSRAFNLPIGEVVNYFVWRQQDWSRNFVQMIARSKYSQNFCHGKSNIELLSHIEKDYGLFPENFHDWQRHGESWFNGQENEECIIFAQDRDKIEELLMEETSVRR